MTHFGILLTDDYDLKIQNGRMVVGNAIYQNLAVICESHPGEIKEHPTLGVGLPSYISNTNAADLKHSIRDNARRDGIAVKSINIGPDGATINVKAEPL